MAQVQYNVKQAREMALSIIESSKYETPLTEEQVAFQRWLMARVVRWSENLLERIEKLPEQIEGLQFQTPAAKTVLLMDVDELPTMTPDQREKAKDRLQRALSSKPPVEPGKGDKGNFKISGRDIKLPPRFRPKTP